MPVILYDLAGREDRRFSPYCWRTRMALAHKGLKCEARPVLFTEIESVEDGALKSVPAIRDGDRLVTDTWQIAKYLEENYPDGPSLFAGPGGMAGAAFVNAWTAHTLHPGVPPLVLTDIFERIDPRDEAYFRQAREKRFGMKLEQVQAGREDRVDAFRALFAPVRAVVKNSPFLGGEQPLYMDYQVFGVLQWMRVISPFQVLAPDDPVLAWFSRCLDLHDGLGRSMPGYWG